MKGYFTFILSVLFLAASSVSSAQKKTAVNYLEVPGPVTFNNLTYYLSWSAHPSANYYKQEYLPSGQSSESFTKMLLLEVITGQLTARELLTAKMTELESMKKSNPYIWYKSYPGNTVDEWLLDFVITANAADGKQINIAEHNVYRYSPMKLNKLTGICLFGISERAYSNSAKAFLTKAKGNQNLVQLVKTYQMPNPTF